jgi:hypothetical protein
MAQKFCFFPTVGGGRGGINLNLIFFRHRREKREEKRREEREKERERERERKKERKRE